MEDQNLKTQLEEALSGADEGDFPAELLAEWEPIACFGKGRQSETFLVKNRGDGSRAVAKLLPAALMEKGPFELLSKLDHPGLPKIIRIWSGEGKACILREYIEGRSVEESGKGFSEQDTMRIGEMICDILRYLHSRTPALIHRDIKPDNIILREDGTPVLIDFGIARLYSESAQTDTRVMGTEHFAPPEQYGFRQTDARSDLYSLGMTLCWMLTGSADSKAVAQVSNRQLRSVLEKCTAFSPEDRYADAEAMKKALCRCGRARRKWPVVAACVLLPLIIAAAVMILNRPQPVRFAEPLIEQAVRQSLGVGENTALTREMLEGVDGLYIFSDAVCADQNGFYTAAGNWYASASKAHGPITTLEDVKLLPNLKCVMVAAQHITDITPLESLKGLEKAEFKHNSISDISPLKGMEQLSSVGLNDNPVTDMTPLLTLPALRFLDLCDASSYDPAFLSELGDMDFLDISNRTESYLYLGTRRVRELKLGWTGINSLDTLSGVTGLERLGIEHTGITSLTGIEVHAELTYLRISGNEIDDLSPLKELPALETLVVSEDMRDKVNALGEVSFTVQYE